VDVEGVCAGCRVDLPRSLHDIGTPRGGHEPYAHPDERPDVNRAGVARVSDVAIADDRAVNVSGRCAGVARSEPRCPSEPVAGSDHAPRGHL